MVGPGLVDRLQRTEIPPSPKRGFFFTRRDQLTFDIRKIGRDSWKYFSKYHYLSEKLPAGSVYLFGLFHDNKQIGFQCFANYVPSVAGQRRIYHFNRTVVHPDYQGLGLGIKLINESARVLLAEHPNIRIMGKFSSVPVYKAMIKAPEWRYIETRRHMGTMSHGQRMERRTGFRDGGIKTYHFEYIGNRSLK